LNNQRLTDRLAGYLQTVSQQFKSRFNYLTLSGLLTGFLISTAFINPLNAIVPIDNRGSEYTHFWSDYENIFVYQPALVKKTFYSILSLKGKSSIARKHIDNEILRCKPDSTVHSTCRIDKLKLQKRAWKVKKYFEVPVNYETVSIRKYYGDPQKRILTIQWQPALFLPSNIAVSTFLEFIGAAENSPFYSVPPQIKRIQYNPIFQKKVEIVIGKAMANNIFAIYQIPLKDFRDSLTFYLESSRIEYKYQTRYINLNLKIKKLKINHQIFKVLTDPIL